MKRILGSVLLIGIWWAQDAGAVPIDLNDFFADPTVTVAADGSSATLVEDPFAGTVLLENNPAVGDPEVITVSAGSVLQMEYSFMEPAGNEDEFAIFLLDGSTTGVFLDSFILTDSGSGTVGFDLSPYAGLTLGLSIQLNALFGDFGLDSAAVVSNPRIVTATVSEPASIALLLLGLIVLTANKLVNRRRFP